MQMQHWKRNLQNYITLAATVKNGNCQYQMVTGQAIRNLSIA